MKIIYFLPIALLFICQHILAQNFSGKVTNENGTPLQNVEVYLLENKTSVFTDADGNWSIPVADSSAKTLVFNKSNYTYEQIIQQVPASNINQTLRLAVKSDATHREDDYKLYGCSSVSIPNDPQWNVKFKFTNLKGDLAPNSTYTRRDPSAVIQVNGKYYVWYSYSLTFDNNKLAPWDLNDIYYSTSTDGITWHEQGKAVGRGDAGSFDARSVFTSEIFVHEGKYYLVYQEAADADGIYNRNTVGMSTASSPDGPWTKLDKPILYPTYTKDLFFDNNAVHDPCIVFYQNKYYLYYKGECNCQDNAGCKTWCNPVCGLNKQVKWGVAIADNPTGPYIKSPYNPITNTGHEVMVWPYANGIAILQHKDGPEAMTIQFAENGLDFNMKGSVTNMPEAAGLFRAEKSTTNPHAGITWGMGHKLNWNAGPKGWMNLYRFDIVSNDIKSLNIVPNKIQLGIGQTRTLDLKLMPFQATGNVITWTSKNENIAKVSNGNVVGINSGTTTVYAQTSDGSISDSCHVLVQSSAFSVNTIPVATNSFTNSGGTFNDTPNGGPGFGFGKTKSGINFVNKNDWATYNISVPNPGIYELSYQISTPSANPEVSLEINNQIVAKDEVFTNGAWDSYYTLFSDSTIRFGQTGNRTIKLIASGADDWQWNMKSLSFTRMAGLEMSTGINKANFADRVKVFFNSTDKMLTISGIKESYKVDIYSLNGMKCASSKHSGDSKIPISLKTQHAYLVKIKYNNDVFVSKLFL